MAKGDWAGSSHWPAALSTSCRKTCGYEGVLHQIRELDSEEGTEEGLHFDRIPIWNCYALSNAVFLKFIGKSGKTSIKNTSFMFIW